MSGPRIALVGLGRANQARLREIQARLHDLQAHGDRDLDWPSSVAVVSRRAGVGTHGWPEVLADQRIVAVVVGTENASHATLAADALRAGKHVLVDFPLATNPRDAAALLQLATEMGLQLHCEFIGLLTSSFQHLRAAVAADPLREVHLQFTADYGGWVQTEAEAGHVGSLLVGRLQQLDALCGPLTWQAGQIRWQDGGFYATAHMLGPHGRVTLTERRAPGLPRGQVWTGVHHSGRPLVPPPAVLGSPAPRGQVQPQGLFAQDLAHFCRSLRTGAPPYVPHDAVQRVLTLGHQLDAWLGHE